MSNAQIKKYNRCKWMAVLSAIFSVMTIGFIIPGALGVAGLNLYNDTLLYLALIDFLFALLFFVGWWSCQYEVDDKETTHSYVRLSKKRRFSAISQHSVASNDSSSTHQLLSLSVAKVQENIKEA